MKKSCGILPYRVINNQLQVFLVHPGGPFFARKDNGYWSISKGELNKDEEPILCAIREFKEETGIDLQERLKELIDLGHITQKNGKEVHAWAIKNDLKGYVDDAGFVDLRDVSNKVQIKIGPKVFETPEINKGQFFDLAIAKIKINEKQWELVKRLMECIDIVSIE